MKVRLLVLSLVLGATAGLSVPARAQIGVYLNPVVTRASMSPADTGTFAFLGSGQTSRFFGGVDFGGYWDFFHPQAINAGVDIRETIVRADTADLKTFSVAARVASNHSFHGIVPYGELAIGAGRSKAADNVLRVTKLEYGIFGGLDVPLSRHVDFRAIELGYGSVTPISSEVERGGCTTTETTSGFVNTCASIPSASLFNMSTGFVFRFGK